MLWKLFSSEEKLNEALENSNRNEASYDLSFGVLPLPSNDDMAAPAVQNESRFIPDVSKKEHQPSPRRNSIVQLTPPVGKSRLYLEDWSEKDEERLRNIDGDEDCWSGFLART